MKKIVILDGYTICAAEDQFHLFEELGQLELYDRTPEGLIIQRIGDAEIVFTDSTYIGKEVMDSCPNMKFIGILATGINSVDIEYARKKGIVVCNVPAYGTDSVSQYAFSLLLYGASRLQTHSQYVQDGYWLQGRDYVPYWQFPFMELRGKTLGVIGFGNIGKRSAKTALAFGMKVVVATGHPVHTEEWKEVRYITLDELFKESDVLFLHCPLTSHNVGFINEEAITKMKDGVILINTARGKLIQEQALANGLNSGKIAFAGLDVLGEEPPTKKNPLLTAKNCIITPHAAWTSKDAGRRLFHVALDNLKGYLNGVIVNSVL